MSIDIGRMNKRINFMKQKEAKNEYSQTVQSLEVFKTVWASIEPVTGKELMEAQKIRPELTYKIYTRYIKEITPDMIISYQGRMFKIISVINYMESNEMLQFICTETVGEKVV